MIENNLQQALEHEPAQVREAAQPSEARPAAESRTLAQLVQKRLEKYVSLLPAVLAGDDPDAVHDVRVWSRRLQQSLTALFPQPRPVKVRKLRRPLRRVRRFLGEWRNCDVVLEMVLREQRRTRSKAKRQAWEQVRQYLLQKRGDQVARARKKLLRQDLLDFSGRTEKLLDQSKGEESAEAVTVRLRAGIEAAWTRWESTLAQAMTTREPRDIHVFRIATKAMRYRTELLHDLGDASTQPFLDWLKELQEALGLWHDRQVLYQMIAEGLARPEFLLQESDAARTLLTVLEKDRLRQGSATNEIFRLAVENSGRRQMETWIGNTPPELAPPDRP